MNIELRNQIVEQNRGLVFFFLRRHLWVDDKRPPRPQSSVEAFWRNLKGDSRPTSDEIQGGMIGLMKAVDRHNPSKGKLSSYSDQWIFYGAIRWSGNPAWTHLQRVNCRRAVPDYQAEFREEPTSPEEILGSFEFDQSEEFEAADLRVMEVVDLVREHLSVKQWAVLSLRAGLYGREKTLREVADKYGVTRERIRQIEAVARKRARGLMYRFFAGRDRGHCPICNGKRKRYCFTCGRPACASQYAVRVRKARGYS